MKLRISELDIYIGYEVAAAMTAALILDRENRVIFCVLAAAMHELGHYVMMRLCSVRVRGLRLRLFDVLIESDEPQSFKSDVLITLAGPAVNLISAAALFPLGTKLWLPQAALGIFNLLPVMSLDGGHLLRICMERRFSPHPCDIVLRITTFLIALPLMTAGIYLLFNSEYNYSFLAISLYLLFILFLKS